MSNLARNQNLLFSLEITQSKGLLRYLKSHSQSSNLKNEMESLNLREMIEESYKISYHYSSGTRIFMLCLEHVETKKKEGKV